MATACLSMDHLPLAYGQSHTFKSRVANAHCRSKLRSQSRPSPDQAQTKSRPSPDQAQTEMLIENSRP